MSKRPYPKKSDEERRIVVSFSLSGDRLKWFREALAASGHEPETKELRVSAQEIAYRSIDAFIEQKIERDNTSLLF